VLSVFPAVLVATAYFHPSSDNTNAFAERLITHLGLNGATAGLVHDTFGSASSNALAASIAVAIKGSSTVEQSQDVLSGSR
jgi:hypothetical protein